MSDRCPSADWDWSQAYQVCLGVSRAILASPADAEDAAQDAVIRAWRKRANCERSGSPTAWWSAIARREALRRLSTRARRREVLAEEPRADEVHLPDVDGLVERVDVERALAALDDHDRALLDLRYARDLTQPAVAEELDIAEGTAKVRLHRLRGRLRQALEVDAA